VVLYGYFHHQHAMTWSDNLPAGRQLRVEQLENFPSPERSIVFCVRRMSLLLLSLDKEAGKISST
jgi:hypothetical protein